MTAIQNSRLWKNLWRDLHNDFRQDESLSILNTSNYDIEVTDDETGVTKIVYPKSIFHTNRPKTSITINQHLDKQSYKATIPRSMIKKNMISIETPRILSHDIAEPTYGDFLSLKWVNKVLKTSDRIIITANSAYYIIVNPSSSNNWLLILILILIAVCAIAIFI